MIAGLPLSFAEPLMLLGLVSLPALWWLLRVMPPRPRRIEFPPTKLLFDIAPKEETPSRTPWWLTLLRLTAAALVILAAAGPIWNPQTGAAGGNGPLVILLDDGWSAASTWEARIKAADELIAKADNDRRGVALVALSEPARDITLMTGGVARVALRQFAPKPYSVERVETLTALDRFLKATGDCEIAWLTDGVDTGRGAEFLEALTKTIGERTLTVFEGGTPAPLALAAAENAAAKMTVKVLRPTSGVAAGVVRAVDAKGSPIGEARYAFGAQDRETEAAFDLPVELRNDIARLEIAGERSAGAVQLLDKRWRRRAIGVVTGSTSDTAQPLLASTFYLTRALSPFADVRLGDRGAPQQVIAQFLDQKLPMIVAADVGTLSPEIRERLNAWIAQGGVLVRFAGPRLAQADDDLVPVKLRRGGRAGSRCRARRYGRRQPACSPRPDRRRGRKARADAQRCRGRDNRPASALRSKAAGRTRQNRRACAAALPSRPWPRPRRPRRASTYSRTSRQSAAAFRQNFRTSADPTSACRRRHGRVPRCPCRVARR